METADLIRDVTGGPAAVSFLSFFVVMIVQVLKELPFLKKIPTNGLALIISMALCTAFICGYGAKDNASFTPYLLGKAILTSFPVYLVSTGGWEKLHEIWLRTAFKEKGETH